MDLLTPELRAQLRANAAAQCEAMSTGDAEPDPAPVIKFYNPLGAATWLATELDDDDNSLFGLADLGFGCPELGSFSLSELTDVRLAGGLRIERDLDVASLIPLSLWADAEGAAGSIAQAEAMLADTDRRLRAALTYLESDQLPPPHGSG